MSKLPSAHNTLQGWDHCPISQMRKLKQMCTCTRRCRENGQLPLLARLLWVLLLLHSFLCLHLVQIPASVKSSWAVSSLSYLPLRKMSRSVILAARVLFPLGSNFCHLHWDTLAPPFNLQLDVIVLVSVTP